MHLALGVLCKQVSGRAQPVSGEELAECHVGAPSVQVAWDSFAGSSTENCSWRDYNSIVKRSWRDLHGKQMLKRRA